MHRGICCTPKWLWREFGKTLCSSPWAGDTNLKSPLETVGGLKLWPPIRRKKKHREIKESYWFTMKVMTGICQSPSENFSSDIQNQSVGNKGMMGIKYINPSIIFLKSQSESLEIANRILLLLNLSHGSSSLKINPLSLGIRPIPSWLQVKSLPSFFYVLFSDLLCHVSPPPTPILRSN